MLSRREFFVGLGAALSAAFFSRREKPSVLVGDPVHCPSLTEPLIIPETRQYIIACDSRDPISQQLLTEALELLATRRIYA